MTESSYVQTGIASNGDNFSGQSTPLDINSRLVWAQSMVALSNLINPHSLWSLWVPLVLLGLILLAAVYFVRVPIR